MNDLLKIEKIREEAASEIIQATSYDHLTEFFWGEKYEIMQKGFANNQCAVLCGHAAYYLNKKLLYYGFESYILTVGYFNNDKTQFSHTLNLVVINKKNLKFTIQDCYLNFGTRDCYFDILKNRNNPNFKIDILQKKYEKKYLLNNLDNKKLSQYNIKKFDYLTINKPVSKFFLSNLKPSWNGYICTADFSLDHYSNLYNEQLSENFEYDNFTNGFKKLHDTLNFLGSEVGYNYKNNILNILYLPYAICGENAYIYINIINSKKYEEIKNYPETNLLIKILN
jgi:hypothetical protein